MGCAYRSKLYGYKRGCRCPDCVQARRAYKRRWYRMTGANLRIGIRGEQKRAWDRSRHH